MEVFSCSGWTIYSVRHRRTKLTQPHSTGNFNQFGPIGAGAVFDLTVLGRGGVPASGVGSVALIVTVARPTAI